MIERNEQHGGGETALLCGDTVRGPGLTGKQFTVARRAARVLVVMWPKEEGRTFLRTRGNLLQSSEQHG